MSSIPKRTVPTSDQTPHLDIRSKDDRKACLKWHDARTGEVFDFRREMESYCRSDVDILLRACLQFRQLLMETTGVDPFTYVTIASVCMGIYKTQFLEGTNRINVRRPAVGGWLVRRDKEWKPLDEWMTVTSKNTRVIPDRPGP